MAETQNLKSCPFCGQDAAVLANEYRNEEGGWFVHCTKCHGSTGLRYSCGEDARPLVIEAWNRRAALSEQPSKDAGEWRPIETAPKDGRILLLGYFNSRGKWRTLRGRWVTAEEIAEMWEDDDFGEGWYEAAVEAEDPNCWGTKPTHWMPLPTPPAAPQPQSTGRDDV